jgi:hypothetical protein
MMIKKRYLMGLSFAIVSVLLGSLLVNNLTIAQTGGSEYDPWIDYNEDGIIDVNDLSPLGQAYGSSGDPTRVVYIKHSTGWWATTHLLLPESSWEFYNTTQGYKQMTLAMKSNLTVSITIYKDYEVFWNSLDSLQNNSPLIRTYDVSTFPSIVIIVSNPSTTYVAEFDFSMYMTA